MESTMANSLENHTLNSDSIKKNIKIDNIKIDDSSPLFDHSAMFYKEFPSDMRQLKFFSSVIMQKIPDVIKEKNLMDKQIQELLKNAIKHGNKNDKTKKVKVYFSFSSEEAHLIIEDEGSGFKEIEQWNDFYRKRCQCFLDENYEEMDKYMNFKTSSSDADDNGCALFEAIKYWNGGIAFNHKRNTIAVLKKFPQKNHGLVIK